MRFSANLLAVTTATLSLTVPALGQSQTPFNCHAPTATVKNGSYAGIYQQNYHQDFFLGIPYAQPPVGDLRLRIPVPLNQTWSGYRNATAYSVECVGYGSDSDGYASGEDCLTLNVIRPAGLEGQDLPVAAWIHGGGYTEGGSADLRYNLSFIVANSVSIGKPIIAVSLNYRLSGWGFLASDEIRASGQTNLGIRDQRLALHWIQENIAAFGGDPSKVTIWGESAGAGSIGIHTTAYGGRDDKLFRSAIGESGSPILLSGSIFSQSQATYDNITHDTGCANATDTLSCLRSVPFSSFDNALRLAINRTMNPYNFAPQPDGDIIRGSQASQLRHGQFVKVPYLIGTNSDEGASFVDYGINTDADFANYVVETGVNDSTVVAMIEALYPDIPALGLPTNVYSRPDSTVGAQFKRGAAFAGDYNFIAARRLTTTQWANYNTSCYAYRFNTLVSGHTADYTGVGHFLEVAFVFNNVQGLGYTSNEFEGMPASYYRLSQLMSDMWVSFIADGTPNHHGHNGVPEWPVYDTGYVGGGYASDMVFDANSSTLAYPEPDTFRGAGIAYINSIWESVYGM